jgi:3-methyladenine DNA glycosylase Tag
MPASEMSAPPQITPKRLGDYLDVMSKAVFQSGISWKVVESKWPTTREAFHDFDAERVASMSEREIDALAADTRVIRNHRKLSAIVGNAARMLELEAEHGSFRNYLRSQPDFDATLKLLRKDFKFLGEMGCYYFLYVVGEEVPPHEEFEARRARRARR